MRVEQDAEGFMGIQRLRGVGERKHITTEGTACGKALKQGGSGPISSNRKEDLSKKENDIRAEEKVRKTMGRAIISH